MPSPSLSFSLSLEEAHSFAKAYCFAQVGETVSCRIPFVLYSPGMWQNIANRVVMASENAESSRIDILKQMGPLSFEEDTPENDGTERVITFQDAGFSHRLALSFNLESQGNQVTVSLDGVDQLAFNLADDDRANPGQDWLFSRVILGSSLSVDGLQRVGINYDFTGLGYPLVVSLPGRTFIWKFTAPDGHFFYFDGSNFTDANGEIVGPEIHAAPTAEDLWWRRYCG